MEILQSMFDQLVFTMEYIFQSPYVILCGFALACWSLSVVRSVLG